MEMYLESVDKTIIFEGAIKEDDLSCIRLGELSYSDLQLIYSEAVDYAENLIEYELEDRSY